MVDAVPDEPTFDLVIAYHVFEHLRDPLATLQMLRRSLRAGGYFLISVPDLGNVHKHGKLHYVTSNVHIFSFTSASLTSLFELAGFEKVRDTHDTEWHELRDEFPNRLRFLARTTDRIPETTTRRRLLGRQRRHEPSRDRPSPLDEAVDALRAYELLRPEFLRQQVEERAARTAAAAALDPGSREQILSSGGPGRSPSA